MNEKPIVIVLSRNYSTGLGIIRSLGVAGYTVDLVASVKKKGSAAIASSSRYVRNSIEVLTEKIQGDEGNGIMDVLIDYALHNDEEKILFPVDDFTAGIVDANRELLKGHFRFPHTDGDMSVIDCMNKTVQGSIAEEKGFLTPKEWEIDLKTFDASEGGIPLFDRDNILNLIEYPCFVKPNISFDGHKTEMRICANSEELDESLKEMRSFYPDRTVLVQEYLNIDREYDLSGVSLGGEVIIPGIIEKTRIAHYEQGVTMSGKMISMEQFVSDLKDTGAGVDDDVADKIRSLIREFGYTGMFDMEFFLACGKLYFGEINFRPGGPNYAYTYSGANLPKILVDELAYGSHDEDEERICSYGKTFTYEKVAWEDYILGYIGRDELLNSLNKVDLKLLDQDIDPEPGKIFARRIRLSGIKHRILQRTGREGKARVQADILVTGKNYGNILNMVRDLGEAGYRVDVLRIDKSRPNPTRPLVSMAPERKGRYLNGYHRMTVTDNSLYKVAEYIRDNCRKGTVVIPVDDLSALAIDENRDMLEGSFHIPGISDGEYSISELMDKSLIREKAGEFGLPVTEACIIADEEDIPPALTYPVFAKPVMSAVSGKRYMGRCDNEEELKEILQYGEVVAEEFVEIDTEYAVLGIACEGKIRSGYVVKTLTGGNGPRKGIAVTGLTMTDDEISDIAKRCNEFVASLGYTGIYDVDLIKTNSGKIYFLEVNFRAGASTRAFSGQGIDLADMYVKALKGDIPERDNSPIREETFVSEKLLLEECAAGTMGYDEALKLMASADNRFIYDVNDAGPYREFIRYFNLFRVLRLRRK